MRKKPKLWIMIADGSRARVVAPGDHAPSYETLHVFDAPEARLSAHVMGESPPGRSLESATVGRHAIEARSDPHEHAEAAFLRGLAGVLNAADKDGSFDRLLLVAQPRVASAIAARLSDGVKTKIAGTVAKDLTKTPDHELGPHLAAVLPVA